MNMPTQPPPGWRPPVHRQAQRESSSLAMVSLICGVGSVGFMAAPKFLVAFAFLVALAGLVTGIEATRRRQGWMAVVGVAVSSLMVLAYAMVALG